MIRRDSSRRGSPASSSGAMRAGFDKAAIARQIGRFVHQQEFQAGPTKAIPRRCFWAQRLDRRPSASPASAACPRPVAQACAPALERPVRADWRDRAGRRGRHRQPAHGAGDIGRGAQRLRRRLAAQFGVFGKTPRPRRGARRSGFTSVSGAARRPASMRAARRRGRCDRSQPTANHCAGRTRSASIPDCAGVAASMPIEMRRRHPHESAANATF